MRTLVLSLALMVACATDPGKDKVAATVQDVPTPEAAAPAEKSVTAGIALPVDLAQSKLACVGAKITEQHLILFHKYVGTITVDGNQIVGIEYTADMTALEADHPRLTEHLLTEDFFWVDKYPTSGFTSTSLTPGSDTEGMTHTVTGDLTIRGKTKRVSFPAKLEIGATHVRASTEFVINRHDFDLTYPGRPDDLIKDNVLLQIDFVAARKPS
jgi:polyisoprenoid-binding protein YceI